MSGHLPDVTPGIPHHSTTISIRRVPNSLQRYCTGIQSSLAGVVCVLDIHVEERGEGLPGSSLAHHEERVANHDLRRRVDMELARRPEHTLEECDQPGRLFNDDAWSNGMPTCGG